MAKVREGKRVQVPKLLQRGPSQSQSYLSSLPRLSINLATFPKAVPPIAIASHLVADSLSTFSDFFRIAENFGN
jgi:hypothetical protein